MPNTDFVHLHIRKLGRPSRLTEAQLTDIISSYTTCTAKELAFKHNCSHWYIKQIWAKHNLKGKTRRRYSVNLDYFEVIDSPDKAYFLGFIASDGCIRRQKRGSFVLSIKISSKDEEVLFRFLSYLKSDIPVSRVHYITPWKKVIKEASWINVISDKMCGDLAKYNIVERKARGYEPVILPDDLMSHFLRGFFDGDGTIYQVGAKSGEYPSHYRLALSVNERTGQFFRTYLECKNIRCSLIEDKSCTHFQLRISDSLSKQRFVELMYYNARGLLLRRKKFLIDKFMSTVTVEKG